MFPITIQQFSPFKIPLPRCARSPPPAAAGNDAAHPHRPPLRPSSGASSAARFCPPTSAVPPGQTKLPDINQAIMAMGIEVIEPKKKGTWVDWVDSKDRKDQRLTWSLNTGDGGVIYSQHLQYLDSNKSSPKGDGELFFEPKNWVIQVKLVISNGETDGRTRALKRLCIYPICSSPSYLAILLYYDSMIFYVFEVKYFVYCVFAFCFSESGIFYSMPFSWSIDCIYLISRLSDSRRPTTIYQYLSINLLTNLVQPNLSHPSIGFNLSCWIHI